jgi:molybdenum cofactor cytidylyltransferase
MKFEEIAVEQGEGWHLAHSILLGGKRHPKACLITAPLIQQLKDHSIATVLAFRLDNGDVEENTAAHFIARHLATEGITVGKAANGRCNLIAAHAGVFMADSALNQLNACTVAIAIATLPNMAAVTAGKIVATIKIIPYAVAGADMVAVTDKKTCLRVKPFRAFQAALLSTGAQMPAKAISATKNRLADVKGQLISLHTCQHTLSGVSSAIKAATRQSLDVLLLSGISAISDIRDILPSALLAAGGDITHLGMPVDPGNLLMLGTLGKTLVVGMPGCAKSPSLNGLDWVLQRYAAGLELNASTIQQMGIGGLLKETTDRPQPRAPGKKHSIGETPVILLAAGKSTRSGSGHKLLANLNGQAVIQQSVSALTKAGFKDIHLVTGARSSEIEKAVDAHEVKFVHNSSYKEGMATSLSAGVTALPTDCEQCLICLGDMPFVSALTYHALLTAADKVSEAEIFIPFFKGKRGNPVLWRRSQFKHLLEITGDKGGRDLISQQQNLVCEVSVDDPGVLIDLDTPEALAQFGITATK